MIELPFVCIYMFTNMQLKKKGTPKKYKHTKKAIRIRRGKEARVEEPNHGRSPREVWSNRLYWTYVLLHQ